MIKKILSILIILLFIGVTIVPTINANVSKTSIDDEFVEFDVELCGLGKKHTVKLTQQEADEVDLLFDDIEHKLSDVETREEAEKIFKEAVVELDKYGLLGGLSVKQAQNLVTDEYQNPYVMKILEMISSNSPKDKNNKENYLCICFLEVNNGALCFDFTLRYLTMFTLAFLYSALITWIEPLLIFNIGVFIFDLFFGLYLYHHDFIKLLYFLDLIQVVEGLNNQEGRLYTIGLLGVKQTDWTSNINLLGFTGMKITTDLSTGEGVYFGTCLRTY